MRLWFEFEARLSAIHGSISYIQLSCLIQYIVIICCLIDHYTGWYCVTALNIEMQIIDTCFEGSNVL